MNLSVVIRLLERRIRPWLWGMVSGWGLVLAGAAAEPGHPYTVRQWNSDQGLPLGPGSAVLQTRDGYLWFGTEEGLGRFDGVNCEVFDSFNTPEMKGNSVTELFEDRSGNLWIANGNHGLLRRRDGVFTYFGQEAGLVNESVSALSESIDGTLWVGTDGGGLFRMGEGRFRPFALTDQVQSSFVTGIASTVDGTVWVCGIDGVHRIRNDAVDFFAERQFGAGRVIVVHVDARGEVWIGGHGVLARVVDGVPVPQPFDPAWGRIDKMASGPDGALWFATPQGVFRWTAEGSSRFTQRDGMAGDVFTDLTVDREGSVWVSTGTSGFDQIKPSRFRVIGTERGLSHQTITTLMQDSKGAIWVGTESGLNRFLDDEVTVFREQDGLSFNLVFTLTESQDGAIWAGTWKGLSRIQEDVFTRYLESDGLPDNVVWCSYTDRDGTLWFGTPDGLVERRDDEFKIWNHDNSGLSHDDVRCILRDRRGRLWVGTSWGLNRMQDGTFENFFQAAENQVFNVVLTLHEDDDGAIWFGTQGNGLFRHHDGRFQRFTTAEGLFDNMIFKILEDDSGNFWLTSNRGLFRVPRSELMAVARGEQERVTGRVFGKQDGLPTPEFNGTVQPNGMKTPDGRLWFASLAGVVVVDPNQMFTNQVPPKVGLESVELDGTSMSYHSGPIVVPPGAERLRLRYAVLSYVSPGALTSRCRLDGFDRAWITNQTRHEAQYTGLRPGEYRFHFDGANGDGVWDAGETSVAVIVQPYYWQTGWFRFGVLFVVVAGLVWVVRAWTMRSHRLALEDVERRHALERERTRISSDLHDDVGSNLGSIALLSRGAQRRADGDAAEQLGEIARLAQETSDAMRDIVWFINPNEDTIQKMSLRMKDTAATLLVGKKVVFETPNLDVQTRLSPQFKRQFFLIFKESLHNVSKHSGATRVIIRLLLRSNALTLEVEDNGCGLRESTTGTGQGLVSMRKRAADQGWRFEIQNVPEGGVRVHLSAPLE